MSSSRSRPPFKVHQLGEIAIRCRDINAMFEFYRDIVGLEVLRDTRADGIAFFRICAGFAGHTTVLALFGAGLDAPATGTGSSLHHLALTVAYEDQDAIRQWFDAKAVEYQVQIFDWIGWQGIFIEDPEGNTVEFVAADRSLLAPASG